MNKRINELAISIAALMVTIILMGVGWLVTGYPPTPYEAAILFLVVAFKMEQDEDKPCH